MITIKQIVPFALTLILSGCLGSSSDDKAADTELGGENEVGLTSTPVKNSLFSSSVLQLKQAYQNDGVISSAYDKSLMRVGSQVLLTVTASTATAGQVNQQLEALGMTNIAQYKHLISGLLPIENLNSLENISGVQWVNSHRATAHSEGIAVNNGEPAMFADVVKRQENLDGSGITIGVLSDSYNCLGGEAFDVSLGDLPSNVEIVKEYSFCNGEEGKPIGNDEGRAMMQIIHDIAPKARLLFYTAFESPVAFAEGIGKLADAGADIIVDDIGWLTMPMFQEGPIAQAVNEVKARGVSYFSAAGNSARKSYEQNTLINQVSGSNDNAHDFGLAAGEASDFYQKIIIPAETNIRISFQWSSPYEIAYAEQGATSDLDIFLFNATKNEVVAQSTDNNIGHNPVEFLSYTTTADTESDTFYLYVRHMAGDNPRKLKYILYGPGLLESEPAEKVFLQPNPDGQYRLVDVNNAEITEGQAVIVLPTENTRFNIIPLDVTQVIRNEAGFPEISLVQGIIDLSTQDIWFVPNGFVAVVLRNGEVVLIAEDAENTATFIANYHTHSSTVVGHANASGAISVGAMSYKQTPWFNGSRSIESFSSAGGTPILYDAKGELLDEPEYHLSPAIIAVDDIDTTFFPFIAEEADSNQNGLPNFKGTSAAAPNAAAVAALLLQKYPYLNPDNVKQSMMQGTVDLTDPANVSNEKILDFNPCAADVVFDWGTGCGLLQADLMFAAVPDLPIDSSFGDFNGNGCIDTEDQERLISALRFNANNIAFDLNQDEQLSEADIAVMDNLLLSTRVCS